MEETCEGEDAQHSTDSEAADYQQVDADVLQTDESRDGIHHIFVTSHHQKHEAAGHAREYHSADGHGPAEEEIEALRQRRGRAYRFPAADGLSLGYETHAHPYCHADKGTKYIGRLPSFDTPEHNHGRGGHEAEEKGPGPDRIVVEDEGDELRKGGDAEEHSDSESQEESPVYGLPELTETAFEQGLPGSCAAE